jgi:hypothetical protein
MSERLPLWTAVRLNEFVRRYSDVLVGLCPPGGIYRHDSIAKIQAEDKLEFARSAAANKENQTTPMVELVGGSVRGIGMATRNLGRLPLLLALSAFDLEAWCSVLIHSGAINEIGPFRDVESPLRHWVMHLALNGHAIGHREDLEPERLLEATHDAGLGIISPPATVGHLWSSFMLIDSTLPELAPQSDQPVWLAETLRTLEERQFGCSLKTGHDAIAVAAGVWQMNGFLERSHELSQSVEGRGKNGAGDYWHAIMHRREPDYGNAKYWCRRVGRHGIHAFLAEDTDHTLANCESKDAARWRSLLTGKGQWNAASFVDLCEYLAERPDAALELAAKKIQFIEMALLLSSTYHDAVG